MPIYVNVSGVWREVTTPSFNSNGTNINLNEVMVNVSGTWKSAWTLATMTAIYYVTPTTTINDINKAIEKMTQGGLVLFSAGEWLVTETIIINKSNITIQGVKGLTRIVANKEYTAPYYGIIWAGGTAENFIENIVIENIEFANSTIGQSDGINLGYVGRNYSIYKEHGIIIRNCYFNVKRDGVYCLDIVINALIEENVFENMQSGVTLRTYGSYCNITNNKFRNCTQNGVEVSVDTTDNTISSNIFENCYVGIEVDDTYENRIISNIFRGNRRGIDINNSSSLIINNNNFETSTNLALSITSSTDIQICNNSCIDNYDSMTLENSNHCIVTGNTINNTTSLYGINVKTCNDILITNNVALNSVGANLAIDSASNNIINVNNITA